MLAANANAGVARSFHPGHAHHSSFNSVVPPRLFPTVMAQGPPNGLTRLDTSGISADLSGGLRTAPPFGGFGGETGMDPFTFGNGNTIDPAQLHFNGDHSSLSLDTPASPFYPMFAGNVSQHPPVMDDDPGIDWITGFEHSMGGLQPNESAIEASSPSAMSTNSPRDVGDNMLGDSARTVTSYMDHMAISGSPMWPNNLANQGPIMGSPTCYDIPTFGFQDQWIGSTDGLSRPTNTFPQHNFPDAPFSPSSALPSMSPAPMMPAFQGPNFSLPMNGNGDTPTASSVSERSSHRHSSVTTASSDSITEATRQVLMRSLAQQAGFGQRKLSQPAISSPLSTTFNNRQKGIGVVQLPPTGDLQRYVSAYIQYFHPHLPFLHISSLSFDSPEYTIPLGAPPGPGQSPPGVSGIAGGGGCLILAMAAIGALYEDEHSTSKELFEAAKKMIQGYLEERRKANVNKAQYGPRGNAEPDNTPLWLVQAMLLNVIYGHNCGDKTSADIASTHCAALVSLARAAELARHSSATSMSPGTSSSNPVIDVPMSDGQVPDATEVDEDAEWVQWRVVEERKRTLYAVFILSSMLVSAYNHAPALTNSEIRLDLPCDEELWSAENPQAWRELGGFVVAQSKSVRFAQALSNLLTASQRQHQQQFSMSQPNFVPGTAAPQSELNPSAFGCLILINALHNYIWETRQRHLGRQWTSKETEAMHAHIEPALKAWQSAWLTNGKHSIERPNPHGLGPLSADSMPLLDLAYVRLYVNLGRSKEAFWQRDWDAMAEELAHGSEFVQQAENSPSPDALSNEPSGEGAPETSVVPSVEAQAQETNASETRPREESPTFASSSLLQPGPSSRREKHLRKAANYAADSLCYSDKMGLTFADYTSRELPLQSAMCAFDCAQVLAEWITTVQERTGRYLGIIGKDDIDFAQIPGMLLLEEEDSRLLKKVEDFLQNAQVKMTGTADPHHASMPGISNEGGLGSKLLRVTAHMLDRSAVWPGKSCIHVNNEG